MTRHAPSISFLAALWVCAIIHVTLCWHHRANAFSLVSPSRVSARQGLVASSSRLHLNNISGWFGRNRKKRHQDNDGESLGGVASIVDSMGDLKTAQRVGQLTDALVKELSSTMVEGSAMEGKVKVTFDCQQKPVGMTIDEGFLSEVDATTLSNAVTTAMQDAHSKSIERMDEKMKSLYAELGLSPAAA